MIGKSLGKKKNPNFETTGYSTFERSPSAFLIKRKNPLKQFPGFFAPSHHQALITNKHKPTVQLLAWLSTAATG